MARKLQLTDGATTVDFLTRAKYGVESLEGLGTPEGGYREVRIRVNTAASSTAVMESRRRAITGLLEKARRRKAEMDSWGDSGWPRVNLKYTPTGGAVTSWLDVVDGRVNHSIPSLEADRLEAQYRQVLDVSVVTEPYFHTGSTVYVLQNLVQNPSFEEWQTTACPSSWTGFGSGGRDANQETSASLRKYGRYSVKLSGSAGGRVQQTVTGLTDGWNYDITWWYATKSGSIQCTFTTGCSQTTGTIAATTMTEGGTGLIAFAGSVLLDFTMTGGSGYLDGVQCQELTAPVGFASYYSIYGAYDSTAGHINYLDIEDIPGDVPAGARLEFTNRRNVNLGRLISGLRSAGSPASMGYFYDMSGTTYANCAGSAAVGVALAENVWTSTCVFNRNLGEDNRGRFYVLARLYDAGAAGTLQARWGASMLGEAYYGDAYSWNAASEWDLIYLGELPLDPMLAQTEGFAASATSASLTVQLRRTTGTASARVDYLALLPAEQAMMITPLTAAGSGDEVVSDSLTRDPHPGGYVADGTAFKYLATVQGTPLRLEAGKANRMYLYRNVDQSLDDATNNAWESTDVKLTYRPYYSTPIGTVS